MVVLKRRSRENERLLGEAFAGGEHARDAVGLECRADKRQRAARDPLHFALVQGHEFARAGRWNRVRLSI